MAALQTKNWNIFAASLMIEMCKRWGSRCFFVSPGYRDAPFIAALQAQSDLQLVSCWDERAAAYQALGWAKATRKAAVLLCTSGTAGANYLPAVIEAESDQVPLLVITADRPFDLVHAGAQQVIDQRGLFGRFVKKSLDFPAPSSNMNAASWIGYTRLLLETAERGPAGPVHINLPFAAPLDPIDDANGPQGKDSEAAQKIFDALPPSFPSALPGLLPEAEATAFQKAVSEAKRGLLILGRMEKKEDQEAARLIRSRLNWPTFADIGSQVKFEGEHEILDLNTPAARTLLDAHKPDCVIHCGRRLVSRFFDDGLKRWDAASYWIFSTEPNIQDPYHLAGRRQWDVDLRSVAALLPNLPKNEATQELDRKFDRLRQRYGNLESETFHFASVSQTLARVNRGESLFVANSTAIRAFDSWCYERQGKGLEVIANRGVSGIEGLLATTIGMALGSGKPWTLVIGDVALLHDLNSLIALAQSPVQVTVVVVNNSGGRIFETLPLQAFSWVKDPLITTPHSFRFEGLASMAGLPYRSCTNSDDFETFYLEMRGRSSVIECIQRADADAQYAKTMRAQELLNDD